MGEEARRFTVDKDVGTNFTFLQEKLKDVFPHLKNRTFIITWRDGEGDSVTVASDEELIIALTEMTGPVYKINIFIKDKQDQIPNTRSDLHVHSGVVCDGCDGQVAGNRYKCLVCPDFDLCMTCEYQGTYPHHKMVRLAEPRSKMPVINPQLMWRVANGRTMCPRRFRCRTDRICKRKEKAHPLELMMWPDLQVLGYQYRLLSQEMNQAETTKCRKDIPKMENRDDQHMENVESILASLFGTIVDAFETVAKDNKEADSSKEEDNNKMEERNVEKENTKRDISPEEGKCEEEWDLVESSDIKQTKKESEKLKVSAEPQKVENSEQASPVDPKIQFALRAMMNMGYTNEGGWLTMLLKDKDGDISKVLDIIQPVQH